MRLRVGTASWTDKTLIDCKKFYPSLCRTPEQRLRYYASRFPLVEVDSSYYAMPKASQRILDDAATDVETWLAGKIADKFARVEGTAFWQGTGAGQPMGLASYSTAATADSSRAWGVFEHVKTGTNGDFNATTKGDPLHDLLGAWVAAALVQAAGQTQEVLDFRGVENLDGHGEISWGSL